ncbi:MAG: arginine--tRNA ligase [Candidatus Pacebacteria bacterium]|nr:arginine--tRNA ligase [Candidatus Paceibacterota bacterium]
MDAKERIIEALTKALKDLGIEGAEPVLERPTDMAHGDYATNVAMVAYARWNVRARQGAMKQVEELGLPALSKQEFKASSIGVLVKEQHFKSPKDLAEKIVEKISKLGFVEKIEIAGPGFINFHLTKEHFLESLKNIDADYGKGNELKGKTVLVEYTQPNILKPFHIGHLMSNAIGESLSRLIENAGADVKRLNYQGDVGLHVAKALWGIKKFGSIDLGDIYALGMAYAHGAQAYESDEKLKAEIDELNKKIYERDPEILELYEAGKKTSLTRFEELYTLLGTKFDKYYLESEVFERGIDLVKEGQEKGIFKESDGAVVFPGEEYGLHTRVFLTSKGLPVYEAKELGLGELKAKDFSFDTSITITAVEQAQYFEVVFKAMGLLRPELAGRFTHVSHGMMQLLGKKMSSRLGNAITGDSLITGLIEEVNEKMGERVPEDQKQSVSQDVGVAAIKYSVLRQALNKNIIFDEEKSLSFEGDSGPYMQYTAVRARSIGVKAKDAGIKPSFDNTPEEIGLLEKMLERFPEVAARAAEEYEPHHVATYGIELASAFNSFYAQEHIVNADDSLSPYRVALTEAVATTLARVLWLLGIRVPQAM